MASNLTKIVISILLAGCFTGCSKSNTSPVDSGSTAEDGLAAFLDEHISQHAKEIKGREISDQRIVKIFDLDGDGNPETIVLYWISYFQHNDSGCYVAVIRSYETLGFDVIHRTYLGGRGTRRVDGLRILDNRIFIETSEFEGGEALSSPSKKMLTEVIKENSTIVLKKMKNIS